MPESSQPTIALSNIDTDLLSVFVKGSNNIKMGVMKIALEKECEKVRGEIKRIKDDTHKLKKERGSLNPIKNDPRERVAIIDGGIENNYDARAKWKERLTILRKLLKEI